MWVWALITFSSLSWGAQPHWKLLYEERFDKPLPVDAAAWVKDDLSPASPWYAGPLSDGGTFFYINGGPAFQKQLDTFSVYRKRVAFGTGGWLTAELAARDSKGRGAPDEPPSLSSGKLAGRSVGLISEPEHDDGILIRNTKPLPPAYRVEYELIALDFGGSRYDQWDYDKRHNGYGTDHPRTSHPWPWGPDKAFEQPYEKWDDVSYGNGFYYLAITDYPDPAPHNNVFIHTHRKVVIDSYNVKSGAFDTCNPAKKEFYRGTDNTLDAFFAIPGTKFESKAAMKTECGTIYGGEGGRTSYIGAAQLVPELMPEQPYRFAIERDATGYTIELSGFFRFVGQKTYRYHRDFVEDGKPIWHYNQTAAEYDGAFNEDWVYEGPFGKYSLPSWPKGSSYPDYFIIGDPHINFYEGSAAIANLRLYVPASTTGVALH